MVHQTLEGVLAAEVGLRVDCESGEEIEKILEAETILDALGMVENLDFLPVSLVLLELLALGLPQVGNELHEIMLLQFVIVMLRSFGGVVNEQVAQLLNDGPLFLRQQVVLHILQGVFAVGDFNCFIFNHSTKQEIINFNGTPSHLFIPYQLVIIKAGEQAQLKQNIAHKLIIQLIMKEQSDRVNRTESIILELNKTGLSYLTHQQFTEAFQYFKQSEKIVNNELAVDPTNIRINKLAGITYNNLACYYKKTNKPKISLIYLQRALEVEVSKVEDWSATASTHLNICAIYSFLKQHEPAANHAELAIKMLDKIDGNLGNEATSKKYSQQELKSITNLRMLGHYNLAIELEHLKRYEPAIEEFSKARDMAKKIGKKHTGIIMVCDQSIARLKETMNQLKDRLIKLVTKKREEEEKGHYYFMRKNKRSMVAIKNEEKERVVSTSLAGKIKVLKIYEQKPHYKTKSILRLRTSPKSNEILGYPNRDAKENRNSSFSHL